MRLIFVVDDDDANISQANKSINIIVLSVLSTYIYLSNFHIRFFPELDAEAGLPTRGGMDKSHPSPNNKRCMVNK